MLSVMEMIWNFFMNFIFKPIDKYILEPIDKYVWEKIKDYFGSVVKPCRFSVVMLIAVLLFWITPQGQDVLRSLGESLNFNKILFFYAALVWWAVNIWYWGRVMLRINYAPPTSRDRDQKQERREEERKKQRSRTRKYFPRFLGVLGFIVCAISFYKASAAYDETALSEFKWRLRGLCVFCLILGGVFYYFLHKRADLSKDLYDRIKGRRFVQRPMLQDLVAGLKMDTNPQTRDTAYDLQYYELKELLSHYPLTRAMLRLALAVSAVLFLLFLFKQSAAAWFGAATIVLLAAGSWVAAGSRLVYWATKKSFPLLTALLLWAILISPLNDNHPVRTLAEKSAPPLAAAPVEDNSGTCNFDKWREKRKEQTVASDFQAWLDERLARWDEQKKATNGPHPVFVVAAEGGGIRAAYWTAIVLTELQRKNQEFADHVYAMSGVSGGSLGISVFAALVEQGRDPSKIRTEAENILGHDFLSPTIAYMLYPDLLQRILPWPIASFDRGRALERSWEEAWEETVGNDNFGKPFHSLYWGESSQAGQPSATADGCGKKSLTVPRLFLNSTWVETGKRVIGSTLKIDNETFKDSVDFFEVVQTAVPLSTAVHNSARFTYVSPAGIVRTPDCKKWGHLVDGGYFENSGATTASEILTKMQESVDAATWSRIVPVVIMIINDPRVEAIDNCGEQFKKGDDACEARSFMGEVLSPPIALMNTRGARGSYARDVLRHLVTEESGENIMGHQRYWKFALKQDKENKKPLPLGWVLSEAAKDNMNDQLVEILENEQIRDPLNLPDEP